MSNFIWNINFLLFWRLAWLNKGNDIIQMDNWGNIGKLYYSKQKDPVGFYILPLGRKIKNLFAKKA